MEYTQGPTYQLPSGRSSLPGPQSVGRTALGPVHPGLTRGGLPLVQCCILEVLLMILIEPLNLNRRCPSEDHVWFEDRWMVASWCDE
jgi:hypothetical protein